jgi:hypothetical protein
LAYRTQNGKSVFILQYMSSSILINPTSVRREDLYASDHDEDVSPSDPEALAARSAALQAQLARVFGPIDIDIPSGPAPHDSAPKHDTNATEPEPEETEVGAFEFRLFATDSATAAPTQKIVIDEPPEPELGDGAFVVPQRESSWYFAEPATGRRREEFESVAVRGEDVLCHQRDRAWGLEVPWRVRILKISKKEATVLKLNGGLGNAVVGMAEEKITRTKPNKKRRIVLRMEKRAREEMEEARRKQREQEKIRQAEKE